ncbi:hypothetical protein IFM89_007447 [Coptis chinensis]|uniref:Uncharacterized protein n=1 Tax=Coptis chinensis TaxID=261450 RepID=A0A835IAP1_9MAGN|nr:hypothetical protein IFM89_007447 [Coptis chinensis]
MLIQRPPYPQSLQRLLTNFSRQTNFTIFPPNLPFNISIPLGPKTFLLIPRAKKSKAQNLKNEVVDVQVEDVDDEDEEFSSQKGFSGREEEKDYDKDPEFAEILGSCFDDPDKAHARVEERIRKKRNKILQPKTGSGTPVKVTFNKFDFSNSYVWFEFYNAPLPNDISIICDTIRSWHIIGRLGGCNSMNMQGANVTPTTFYNIGDFEVQENLGRVWMDIGTSEPLLLDVLINALTQISSDYVGIKQLVFGGSEFESWKENMTSEAAGYSVHKI